MSCTYQAGEVGGWWFSYSYAVCIYIYVYISVSKVGGDVHCSLPLLVWSMIKIEEEDEDTIGAVVFLRLELKLLWLKFPRLNTLELP